MRRGSWKEEEEEEYEEEEEEEGGQQGDGCAQWPGTGLGPAYTYVFALSLASSCSLALSLSLAPCYLWLFACDVYLPDNIKNRWGSASLMCSAASRHESWGGSFYLFIYLFIFGVWSWRSTPR